MAKDKELMQEPKADEAVPSVKQETEALVKMARSKELSGDGPTTAEVHPKEVIDWARHGWYEVR